MAQEQAWENEYKTMKMITGGELPQKDILRYLKYLRKEQKLNLENKVILDLGSGTGRNSNYLASLDNNVYGIEISRTAVNLARTRATAEKINVKYTIGSFGKELDFSDNFFDLIIDMTSSNALSDTERDTYLEETFRILKPGGHFFVRALSKEGDKNAKNLIKNSPGPDPDSYYMQDLDLYEKVFTEETFRERYETLFIIDSIIKKTGYATVSGRKYKRNYLISYMRKA